MARGMRRPGQKRRATTGRPQQTTSAPRQKRASRGVPQHGKVPDLYANDPAPKPRSGGMDPSDGLRVEPGAGMNLPQLGGPSGGNSMGGQGGQGGQGGLMPAQQPEALDPVTSVKQMGGRIGPDNTLRNRRIGGPSAGSDYGAGSLLSNVISGNALDRSDLIQSHMDAALPMLEEQRMKRMDSLMGKTAAMGRTGSGMFNTDVGNLELASRRGRESLLGKLSAQAAGQEIQDRLGATDRATRLRGQNLQESQAQTQHLRGERNYENQLARQAMSDEARRLGFMQSQMNQYNPTQALQRGADTAMAGGDRYGANAANIGNQLSQGAQAMMQAQGAQGGGGGGILDFVGDAAQQFLGGGGGMPVSAPTGSPYSGAGMHTEKVSVPDVNLPTLG